MCVCWQIREKVYAAFELYHKLRNEEEWDDADRALVLIRHVIAAAQERFPSCAESGAALREFLQSHTPLFEKVYADEVQDCTTTQLLVLAIASAADMSRMFLAGDTAQQCVPGVEFRFKEIRKLAHFLGGQTFPDPLNLHINFRYSKQIHRLAQAVFDKLITIFPDSADIVADAAIDDGRVQPMYLMKSEQIEQLLQLDSGSVILARDTASLQNRIGNHPSISIAESKGLEFMNVIILDFFKESQRQREWKHYCLDSESSLGIEDLDDAEMEAELKLLFVAIGRSLFIVVAIN